MEKEENKGKNGRKEEERGKGAAAGPSRFLFRFNAQLTLLVHVPGPILH